MGDKPFAVIVPVYGRQELTDALMTDLRRERELADLLVVDNGGDYVASGDEVVMRPGTNLGWLRACNAGLEHRRPGNYEGYVLLNNDTRLSPGFLAGLLVDARRKNVGLVGPCYDDYWAHQQCGYLGPADGYRPGDGSVRVPFLDGTCLVLTAEALRRVGPLDESSFPTTGWGAEIDLALRTRRAGMTVVVTRRAYLNHFRGSTAHTVATVDGYLEAGKAEMVAGLSRKWGRRWMALTGVDGWWSPYRGGHTAHRLRARLRRR